MGLTLSLRTAAGVLALALGGWSSAGLAAEAKPPFIPVERHYLDLPAGMQPVYPTFVSNDQDILFRNAADERAWLIGADGSGLQCVTCGFADHPKIESAFIYAFADGKRLMFTPGVAPAVDAGPNVNGWVLECAPSLRDCASHRFLPIDMGADRGEFPVFQRRTWHLAPDDVHIGWMDVRADGTVMVVARLERQADKYVAADPRAVNPLGPRSASDDDADRWENLTQLYEIKSFTPDGKGIVAVGLPSNNIDMLRIDLATGRTTRLTAHPDWDEDGSLSPDQASLVSFAWRARHRLDALGWIPQIRGFSGLMIGAAMAPYYVSTWEGFQCDLSPWLLPGKGDDGGALLGQPLDVYGDGLTAASHQQGPQNWSQDSTRLLLQERTRTKGIWSPSRIAMARLERAPTQPTPAGPTVIGDWALPASLYRGPHAQDRQVTVRGKAGGRATIALTGKLGGGGATTKVVFDRFTDDGATFVSGTMTQAAERQGEGERRGWSLFSNVKVTGRHTGALAMDLRVDNAARPLPKMIGAISASYDGKVAPPLPSLGACYAAQPKASPLRLDLKSVANGLQATVTADVYGDVRPVINATVRSGGQAVRTDSRGQAILDGAMGEVSASAGDTFLPARASVRP